MKNENIGVYLIFCKETGIPYIGSSKNIKAQIREHISKLNKKCHRNPNLQKDWNKYGEKSFDFLTIENVEQKHLKQSEKFWLDAYGGVEECYNSNDIYTSYGDLNTIEESYIRLKSQKKVGEELNIPTWIVQQELKKSTNKKIIAILKKNNNKLNSTLTVNKVETAYLKYKTIKKTASALNVSIHAVQRWLYKSHNPDVINLLEKNTCKKRRVL